MSMDDFSEHSSSSSEKNLIAGRFRGFLPVVLDVETSGFNCNTDAILEIAAITLSMDESGFIFEDRVYSAAVEPFEGANIEQAALEFTGIKLDDPDRNAKPEEEVFKELFQMVRKAVKANGCKRAIIVAHNASFDHGFVNAASKRCDMKRDPFHPFTTFDTAALAGLAVGQTVLARACQVSDIDFSNSEAHSALYDTEKTAELFCSIVNRWKNLGGWLDEMSD